MFQATAMALNKSILLITKLLYHVPCVKFNLKKACYTHTSFHSLLTGGFLGSKRTLQHTVYSLYPLIPIIITGSRQIVCALRCAKCKRKTLIPCSRCNTNSNTVAIQHVAQKYLPLWVGIL